MYKIKENIQLELIENEAIIIDENNGRFLSTNPIGYCILAAFQKGNNIEEIISEFSQHFSVPIEESTIIINDYINNLIENGILEK